MLEGAKESAVRLREEDLRARASCRTRMARGGGLKPGLSGTKFPAQTLIKCE